MRTELAAQIDNFVTVHTFNKQYCVKGRIKSVRWKTFTIEDVNPNGELVGYVTLPIRDVSALFTEYRNDLDLRLKSVYNHESEQKE